MSEKKHILITGGAGYIGSLLKAEVLRDGIYVTVVDNPLTLRTGIIWNPQDEKYTIARFIVQ